ncbi:L-dopachrome tautomerase-related protein [uncultured Flavobacterium sp.]|uniref:L-dopachrome tautomerase-related protein n=1 Tax=uncultured Flavobacterium sp. TaxID=165435 RepID=UPI0030EEAB33|tara:strand:+ start:92 stop:1183 length:1092 start_codon:yes stop_codon:yes gene_type:complete
MKNIFYISLLIFVAVACKEEATEHEYIDNEVISFVVPAKAIRVADFKGQQVTGITVTDSGRIFVNFPRWRKGVTNSVVEVGDNNKITSYPDAKWNSWEVNQKVVPNKFVGVQSVIAVENNLYVLDTRNPMFAKVVDAPRVFVFDLTTNQLAKTYVFDKNSFHTDSYINDLRVDLKKNTIYFTDSGNSGLVVLDMKTGKTKRVLDNHISTAAEVNFLTFEGKKWERTVNSDGIALDNLGNTLYFHALTGYHLYAVDTDILENGNEKAIEANVRVIAKTPAPDGMLFNTNGDLYFADLEKNKILYRKNDGIIKVLLEGKAVKWADSFSIHDGYLYYTNSRINEVDGDISDMIFTLNKVLLPMDED